jgi:phage-related protein
MRDLTVYGKYTIQTSVNNKPSAKSPISAIARAQTPLLARPVVWIGSSKADVSELPDPVKASFGHRLHQVQEGRMPFDTKPLSQFGAGVLELRESFDRNAYRLMYVVALRKAVYVLHAFNKKLKSGIGLPKPDADLIALRLKRAQALDAED